MGDIPITIRDGTIVLTLGDGTMITGHGVGADAATLGDGAAGVTVRYGGVVGSGRGVGGASTGGGDGGRVRTEEARVDVGSVGVAIDVAEILAMSCIACNCLSIKVEKGVTGEGITSAAVRARASEIAWLVEEACFTGNWWGKHWTVLEISLERVLGMYTR